MSDALTTELLQSHLNALRLGDTAARGRLLETACDRLRHLTRQMLRQFGHVRSFEQTDDVLNNAVIRLMRALGDADVLARLATARDFLRLAAAQVRRELIDLARHYASAKAQFLQPAADDVNRSGPEPAETTFDPAGLALWSEFHRCAEELPADEKEVFDLLWYQELSKVEAARVLGVDEKTVRRRFQAAQRRLYDRLGGRLPF
jgi:RNA polymerase sigma factor (sigma-70 family)